MSEERPPLGERLEVPVDEERLARTWGAIAARLHGPDAARRRRPSRSRAVGAALAAALALLAYGAWTSRPGAPAAGPLTLSDGAALAHRLGDRAARGDTVTLSDGSSIHFGRGTRAEPLENTGERFSVVLREGRARVAVTPGGPRRWVVEAGHATVEVVGTVFTVERDAGAVSVSVERGRVLVRGASIPDGVQSLAPGESLRVPTGEPPPSEPLARGDARPAVRPEPAPPHEEREVAPRAAAPAPGEAIRWAPRHGADEPAPGDPEPTAGALLAAADTARREGRLDDALEQLRRAAQRPDDPDAALASLTRGRLALEHGRGGEATADLQRALRLGLPSALEETARARLVEANLARGDAAAAREAAEDYRRRYPAGAFRAQVTRVLDGSDPTP